SKETEGGGGVGAGRPRDRNSGDTVAFLDDPGYPASNLRSIRLIPVYDRHVAGTIRSERRPRVTRRASPHARTPVPDTGRGGPRPDVAGPTQTPVRDHRPNPAARPQPGPGRPVPGRREVLPGALRGRGRQPLPGRRGRPKTAPPGRRVARPP